MKSILEYLVNNHMKNNGDFEGIYLDITFKDFCKIPNNDKINLFNNYLKYINDLFNKAKANKDTTIHSSIKFNDSYLHIGICLFDEEDNESFDTAFLLSDNKEYPDDEWSDCDSRGVIPIAFDIESKLCTFVDDIRFYKDYLIEHKIEKY